MYRAKRQKLQAEQEADSDDYDSDELEELIDYKIKTALTEIEFIEDIDDSDADDAIDELLDDLHGDLFILYTALESKDAVPAKQKEWHNEILNFDDAQFEQMLRVNRTQFALIHSLIKDDPIFNKPSKIRQVPVDLQLAIVLCRLGATGENASVRKISRIFKVGDGGTLNNFTNRIFDAILRNLLKYINWPNATNREKMVKATSHELPNCIGYVGTHEIKLSVKPEMNTVAYYSKRDLYSVKMQIVCDNKLRIRNVSVGNPGSYTNEQIFENSKLYKMREQHLSDDQWLAADVDYPLLDFLITPYKNNSNLADVETQEKFNKRFMKYHSRVKRCISALKEKFCSLNEIRILIKNKESQTLFNNWVIVCCILYNILLEEKTEECEEMSEQTEDENEPIDEDDELEEEEEDATFEAKRQEIYDLMFK